MESVGIGMDSCFWRGKRVLITGHTGFKGSWLSFWLERRGAQVSGFALAPLTQPSLFDEAKISRCLAHHRLGDIRRFGVVRRVVGEFAPEIVFHLAAQPVVRRSYDKPVETFATNVMGTVHVLDAVRQTAGVRVVINVTTDKVYENQERRRGYRETDQLGGRDPYSCSKACSELVTASYRQSFLSIASGIALATARAGNVIGGGDWTQDRLIPDLVRAVDTGPVPIRNPQARRPWQHVLEPLHGYILLAEALWTGAGREVSHAWNFGPSARSSCSVARIVRLFCAHWKNHPGWVWDDAPRVHEAQNLALNADRARRWLGWKSILTLEETVAWTASWYQEYQAGTDATTLMTQQIARYEKILNDRGSGT